MKNKVFDQKRKDITHIFFQKTSAVQGKILLVKPSGHIAQDCL